MIDTTTIIEGTWEEVSPTSTITSMALTTRSTPTSFPIEAVYQAILDHVDPRETQDILQLMQSLAQIEHTASPSETLIQETFDQWGIQVQEVIDVLRSTELFLGFLMHLFVNSRLYTLLGQPSIEHLFEQMGYDRNATQKVRSAFETWIYMHNLGYTLDNLMKLQHPLDETKMHIILRKKVGEQRQLEQRREEVMRQRYQNANAPMSKGEDATGVMVSKKDLHTFEQTLSPDELTRLEEQAQRLYRASARAELDHMLGLRTSDLLAEQSKNRGEGIPPTVILNGTMIGDRFVGLFSIPITAQGLMALSKNNFILRVSEHSMNDTERGSLLSLELHLMQHTNEQQSGIMTFKQFAEKYEPVYTAPDEESIWSEE